MYNRKTNKSIYRQFGCVAVFTVLTVITLFNRFLSGSTNVQRSTCTSECHGAALSYPPEVLRLSKRLQRRLETNGTAVPSLAAVADAVMQRSSMLKQEVTVRIQNSSETELAKLNIQPGSSASFFTLKHTWGGFAFVPDEQSISAALAAGTFGHLREVADVHVQSAKRDSDNVLRTNVPIAHDGFDYSHAKLSSLIANAFLTKHNDIQLTLPFRPARVTMEQDGKNIELTLLSTGRSEFSNSPDNRIWNVHKAFNERVNNIILKQGETFSFVGALNAPVTLEKGWKEALGLFGGGTANTPGGGICQAATTTYRAALLAGLPILYRRNHSVFVDHYEQFGVGLDATIFPGVHDLLFQNDTPGDVLFQAYTEGELAYVNVYGIPDNRNVELDGPYFNTTQQRAKELRALSHDQIGWVNRVTYPDGTVRAQPIVSTYHTGFLRSVKETYAGTPGTELLFIPEPGQTLASTDQNTL